MWNSLSILEQASSNRVYDVSMQRGKAMATYNIELKEDTLHINFGEPAQNDQIVKDASARLEEMAKSGELRGG